MSEFFMQMHFIPLALWNMMRFDFQVLSYIAALPTIILFTASFFKEKEIVVRGIRWFYTIIYTLLATLILADICFYKNFSDHFNITVFDFFNEEPLTLIQTFWEEYSVFWILICIFIIAYIVSRVNLKCAPHKRNYSLLIVWIAVTAVMMRGSVTEFPLQVEDINVSPSKKLNDCVPNAAYYMKKAWSEKRNSFVIESQETLLHQFEFSSIDEAWEALGNKEKELFSTMTDSLSFPIEGKHPDIVIILSESWSGYLTDLGLERKDENLLCGMRRHLQEDLLFQNYQSVQNGTIATIENLLISTSFPRVFESKYRYTKFPTSFALPFQQNGYETIFMSGMDEGWENIGIGLETQGFKKIFKYEFLAAHPEYECNSVGIFDHHVMNSLHEELCKTSSKPRLFIVMTTTNHPPFVYPKNAEFPTLPETFYKNPAFDNSEDIQQKYIRGFQYNNQSLAGFLDRFKKSDKASNTIVLITGDHNVRNALNYGKDATPEEWRHRVPLYIFLPEKYRGTSDGTYQCETKKWGCHYDIITTLAPFAFEAGTKYLNIGQNLLSCNLNERNTVSYNVDGMLFDKNNSSAERRLKACDLLLRLYLQDFLTK